MFWNGEICILLKNLFIKNILSKTYVLTILDLLICISENVKKKRFFGGVRKNPFFAVRGGAENFTDMSI